MERDIIKMEKDKYRNSNIELLRILCIIFIILHHSYYHSLLTIDFNNINYIVLYIIQFSGRIANNIFIMITGYYMVNSNIKKKSIFKLICETIFYSYIILFIYCIFTPEKDINLIIGSIIPIMSNSEWFVTAYLLLYISIPYINILINNLDKKEYSILIIFMVLCFSILPTITLLKQYSSYYIWFICLYFIGAYLKLYSNKQLLEKNKHLLLVSVISLLIFVFAVQYFGTNKFMIGEINNFILFILSLNIFVAFIKKKNWYNRNVNYIASSVLGIYLIHDNIIVRAILWKNINIPAYINTNYFWLYEICVIIFIFSICLLIDKVREKYIERPLFNFIEKRYKNKNIEKENI